MIPKLGLQDPLSSIESFILSNRVFMKQKSTVFYLFYIGNSY